ncbi:prolipoprotein diacylglyceryl transferase [uncultured Eubacterium sp.]|uniref:prolipoprotein diacylglyceryl transferase n=1 Tax=uncultured Eubacterium sp. TaxID=165185 RepID=UPI0026741211|nr:prolipoprotein diacylglyceryl transferase [uncultured Eubacterium sp.]
MILSTAIEFPNLHIGIENLPKSFSVFGFDIAFYGCILAIGMLAGIVIACAEAKRTGQDYNQYIDFALYAIVFSIIGARIYYVAFSWDYYSKHLSEIINIRNGGLAIYGSVIAAVLTCFIYTRIKKMSFAKMCDTAVLGLLAGQIIGRWGNFFNREAFGGVANDSNPWAMRIYFDDNYSISQVPEAVRNGMETLRGKALSEIGYIQVQPTFLYESLWNLFVLILILIFRKKKKFDGEVILWYLIGYGIGRAVIEGMRTDQLIMPVTGWPVSQALSIVVAIAAVVIVIIKRVKAMSK